MKKFLIGLRSLGILLGVWLVLAVVALIAGVIPSVQLGGSSAATHGSAEAADTSDAGAVDAGAAGLDSGPERAVDAGVLAAAAADAGHDDGGQSPLEHRPAAAAALRVRVCASDVFDPVLVAADVLRSGASELLVGCGDRFSLLSVEPSGEGIRVSRVARFSLAQGPPGTEARARDVAAGDIDMDGRVDLLFGFVLLRPGQGGPQGGALDWVGRDPNSGFTPGHRLAPIAATRVALADVDGNPGADPVALNATDPHGRRLSEVWIFGGGASPERLAKPSVGRGGLDFALLDLDGDDHLDLAALSYEAPRLTLFFGDGAAHFEGPTALALAQGSRLTVGSRQPTESSPGSRELLISGATWSRVTPGPREEIQPASLSLTDAERAARVQGLTRVVSGGHSDLVGLVGHDLVALERLAEGRSGLRVLRSFPPSFLPLVFATGELDGRRGLDLAALGRGTAPDAPLELVILSDFSFDAPGGPGAPGAAGDTPAGSGAMTHDPMIALATTLTPLKDAPLSLRVALP